MDDAPTPRSVTNQREAVDRYDFRTLHPHVRFGTASDRYAGWLGQIYPKEVYGDRISSRKRTLSG